MSSSPAASPIDHVTAGALVSRLAELAALRDISVLEPAIEDVVARLYTREGR